MAQKAAIEALRHGEEEMRKMVDNYNYRRKIMLSGFSEIGLECFEPRGAFYCFPQITSSGMSSEEFCEKLLIENKVAAYQELPRFLRGGFKCCLRCQCKTTSESINAWKNS